MSKSNDIDNLSVLKELSSLIVYFFGYSYHAIFDIAIFDIIGRLDSCQLFY